MPKIITKSFNTNDPNERSTGVLTVQIRSTAPLIYGRMPPQAVIEILEKAEGKAEANAAKMPRDRFREAFRSIHFFGDAQPTSWEEVQSGKATNPNTGKKEPIRYGFPVGGFHGAMVRAASMHGEEMTKARMKFRVIGDWKNLVHIKATEIPSYRIDHVQAGAVAVRATIQEWTAVLRIEFNCRLVSAEQLLSWLRMAGAMVGLGAWRITGKMSSGEHGSFEMVGEAKVIQPDVQLIEEQPKKKGRGRRTA